MTDADDSLDEGYVHDDDAEAFADADDSLGDVPDGDVVIIAPPDEEYDA